MPFDENFISRRGGGDDPNHNFELIDQSADMVLKLLISGLMDAGQCRTCVMWLVAHKALLIALVNEDSESEAAANLADMARIVMENARNEEFTSWSK